MSWKAKLLRWAGSAALKSLWPRAKAAGKAAWKALKENPVEPTEKPE